MLSGSIEGVPGRSRYRSPASEDHPEAIEGDQPSASVPRRRQLRANPVADDRSKSSSPTWVGAGREEPRKAKADPETAQKERDTVGFLPKLGRILEGKESKAPGRRRSSTTSSSEGYTTARRRFRQPQNATVRRPVRQKHGSLQRRAEALQLGNLPNHSVISVLSGVTQHPSTSSGSNSTVTQKSFEGNHPANQRPMKETKRVSGRATHRQRKAMESPQQHSDVFRFMNESMDSEQNDGPHIRPESSSSKSSNKTIDEHARPGSSASYSSSASSHGEGLLTDNEEPEVESPMTSPASVTLDHASSRYRERGPNNGISISIGGSSPQYIPFPMHPETEEYDDDEDEGESDDSEDDDVEVADGADDHNERLGHADNLALERTAPPRLPSATSSRHSDPHTRRLRHQEQELRDHVLQSPQPHRDFHFQGGPSPHPHHAMPLYEAPSQSGASPTNLHASHAPGWPPPSAPPPPSIGFYSPSQMPHAPYFTGAENAFAMQAHNYSMAPVPTQPFHPTHAQPPHYQLNPIGPDLSKTTVVGYELLADKLTEAAKTGVGETGGEEVLPMYRKFEKLNHRVLLHLQDEISELEEELRYLDETIAQSGPSQPSSRRGDARYGGEWHYRRTDLLGRIYIKLGQYNQALSSFSSMLKNLDPANTDDIQVYHTWMERHAPIDKAETRFLERKNDLLTVSRNTTRRSASSVGGVGLHQSMAIGLPLIAVLPLIALAVVPGLLGRLFIIVLIGTAEVAVVVSTELIDFMTVQEWVICASM
ncbi:hypothetical protein BDV96DRAFT_599578 [Lophiotrema nucula]|uniref:DUF6594 domain-containing protein n=1 Tax=Lophiotrema nucula TaxID=690887 RepID=A0A6A5Z6U7_9PLEO|nr:hypothetical protein BDV96DRAFT_599578 [Lophiotrema nucula]